MTALVLIFVAFAAAYGVAAWLRAEGGSVLDVVRQDVERIRTRTRGDNLIAPEPPVAPPGLFSVTGRHEYREPEEAADLPRTKVRRQRGGVEIGQMPEGGGRVRNPNAPCWLCGQKKTPNHKCS